jgi:hypothetical protein
MPSVHALHKSNYGAKENEKEIVNKINGLWGMNAKAQPVDAEYSAVTDRHPRQQPCLSV